MIDKLSELYKSLDSHNDDLSDMHTRGIIDGWAELPVESN